MHRANPQMFFFYMLVLCLLIIVNRVITVFAAFTLALKLLLKKNLRLRFVVDAK